MNNRNLFAAAFFIVFLIALSNAASDSQSLGEGLTTDNQERIETINEIHYISYDVNDPILIVNDTDFEDQAFNEGWSGNGNEGNPYIIEDLDISTASTCIEINDVNASFVIMSCLLRYNGMDDSGTGVLLSNATHGSVESCVFTMKTDAIRASTSHNLVVFNNTVTNGMSGVYLSSSNYCTVLNNSVSDCYYGAMCFNSYHLTLCNNTHTLCTMGVFTNGCDYATLKDNTMQASSGGVSIWNADHATLLNNTIQGGSSHDVVLKGSRYCNLTDNNLNGFGLYIDAFQLVYWSHDLLNNMVQGRSLGYYLSASGQDIDVSSHGQTFLVDCTGVTLRNGQFSNVMNGMIMVYSEDCAVVNCTAHGSWYHGLRMRSCTNCSSVNCTLYDNGFSGIQIDSSPNSHVRNNTIYDNYQGDGINIGFSSDCTVEECTLVDDGVTIDFYNLGHLRHDFSDNTVNGKDLGYYWNLTDTVLDGDLFGQIILGNCSRVKVEGGYSHDIRTGMIFGYCTDCELKNAVLEDCNRIGLHLQYSDNCTVRSSEFIECYERGIYCSSSTNCTLDLNIAQGCMHGISIFQSSLVVASNNSVSDSDLYGIRIRLSENVTAWNNTIVSSDEALVLDDSSYCILSNNSLVFNSDRGLNIEGSDFCVVTHNWIFDSGPYGIDVDGSWNITFYGNLLGSHSMLNARDNGWDNTWDDSASVGNAWDDYVGPGVYAISGTALSEDRYPSTLTEVPSPIINSPDDIEYESGTTGHLISWNPLSSEPDSFEVYRNATSIDSGVWDGSDITVEIDGLDLGLYNYTLVVMDTFSNSATDTAFVSVVDTTPPDVEDSPDDVEYEVGSTGHSITWIPNDVNPLSYDIFKAGVSTQFGDWNSSSEDITINVSGLSIGTYNYTLFLMDTVGNSAADTVFVSVVEALPPDIGTPPDDIEYEAGSTGYSITWSPTDLSPFSYEIFKDGVSVRFGDWNASSEDIVIAVSGLSIGTYNYTLVVMDTIGNSAADTVFVSVVDTTPPDVGTPPDDMEYEIGSTGHSITWSPTDLNPSSYEILRDGVSVRFGDWNVSSEDIVIGVSGLSVGVFNYTLVVMDASGNFATDTAFVSVVDSTPPSWVASPSDQSIDYGQALEYQLQATDISGIGAWHINDTANFVISGTGYLENSTVLEIGDYGLNISVEDIYGNTRSFTIRISVLPSTATTPTTATTPISSTTPTQPASPVWSIILSNPIFIALGIGAAVIVIAVIVTIRRRRGNYYY
jgi:parallel beta-helix repeat protein